MSERRKTLLIVDDEAIVRDSLASALRADYRILRAASGEGALQLMEREAVDLMVLDVTLPGISGFDVLKITKENYPAIEVIVVSEAQQLETAIALHDD